MHKFSFFSHKERVKTKISKVDLGCDMHPGTIFVHRLITAEMSSMFTFSFLYILCPDENHC